MKLYSVHLYRYVIYPQRRRNFRASTAKIGIRSCPPKISNKANRATYVPYFYSKDGYAALGHSNVTHFNRMAARSLVGSPVGWEVLLTHIPPPPLWWCKVCKVPVFEMILGDVGPLSLPVIRILERPWHVISLCICMHAGITLLDNNSHGHLKVLFNCFSCLLPPWQKAPVCRCWVGTKQHNRSVDYCGLGYFCLSTFKDSAKGNFTQKVWKFHKTCTQFAFRIRAVRNFGSTFDSSFDTGKGFEVITKRLITHTQHMRNAYLWLNRIDEQLPGLWHHSCIHISEIAMSTIRHILQRIVSQENLWWPSLGTKAYYALTGPPAVPPRRVGAPFRQQGCCKRLTCFGDKKWEGQISHSKWSPWNTYIL